MATPFSDATNRVPLAAIPLPSSKDMADAVVAQAMAERARLTQQNDENLVPTTNKARAGTKRSHSSTLLEHDSGAPTDPEEQLKEVMASGSEDDNRHEAVTQIMFDSIDNLMQEGLKAFHANESTSRDLTIAKEEMDSKDRDLQRLRSSEESSRNTITVSQSEHVLSFHPFSTETHHHLLCPSFFRISSAPLKHPRAMLVTLLVMHRLKLSFAVIFRLFVVNVTKPWDLLLLSSAKYLCWTKACASGRPSLLEWSKKRSRLNATVALQSPWPRASAARHRLTLISTSAKLLNSRISSRLSRRSSQSKSCRLTLCVVSRNAP
jgi:hypothetical protein